MKRWLVFVLVGMFLVSTIGFASAASASTNPLADVVCRLFGVWCPQLAPPGIPSSGDGTNALIPNEISEADPTLRSPVRFPLYTPTSPLFLNDTINKATPFISKRELPTILADGIFNGNVAATYVQAIRIGGLPNTLPQIVYGIHPTVDDDPRDAVQLGMSAMAEVYTLNINFRPSVDFTHNASLGKSLVLFGKTFVVDASTTPSQLVLSNQGNLFRFSENERIQLNNVSIQGTLVDFNMDNTVNVSNLRIIIFAPHRDLDAITETMPFRDPVFGTIGLEYGGLHIPLRADTDMREPISVEPLGDDRMNLNMINYNGIQRNFTFARENAGVIELYYDRGVWPQRIKVMESAPLIRDMLVVVGNENKGHLLRLTSVYNNSFTFSDDYVRFRDIFSRVDRDYHASSEGRGTLEIDGQSYIFTYSGSAADQDNIIVRLNYPDSAGVTGIAYPTIQTSKGAKVALYEPLAFNLNSLPTFYGGVYRGNVSIMLPNGDGYAPNVNFAREPGIGLYRVTGGSNSVNAILRTLNVSSTVSFKIGELTYEVRGTGTDGGTVLSLRDVAGQIISAAGLVVFEERDDSGKNHALIVTLEGNGTGYNWIGVKDVQSTWAGSDSNWQSWKSFESDDDLAGKTDRYASLIFKDQTDYDQQKATIYYPDNQAKALVYIREIF